MIFQKGQVFDMPTPKKFRPIAVRFAREDRACSHASVRHCPEAPGTVIFGKFNVESLSNTKHNTQASVDDGPAFRA